jgi:monoamine oxidase
VACYDAVIVGAGAAGLAALGELHAAGLRVLCIEALDRIGGRIYTVHDPLSPAAIELGAEFVHGRPPEIFDLIESAKLPAVERVHEMHYASGSQRQEDDDDGAMWRLMSAVEKAAANGPDRSFADFASHAPFDDRAKRAAKNFVEGFNAARAEIVGIQALAQESKAADAIEGDRSFHLIEGYDALARALLPAGAELRLNTVAERIAWKPGEVVVHIRSALDGAKQSIEARCAIVTVSIGVLQSGTIEFEPEPAEALAAAQDLAFGQAFRVTFRFDRVPEFLRPGFILSDEPVFPAWWSTMPLQSPLITGWSAGPKADPLLGHARESIVARATESLRKIAGRDLPPIAAAYFHDWHADPFFRGAYSYVPVAKLSAREALARPVDDTLYFAGEAANVSGHAATVHGAIESGRTAALSVVLERATIFEISRHAF